jgi:hypothetical protein
VAIAEEGEVGTDAGCGKRSRVRRPRRGRRVQCCRIAVVAKVCNGC